MADVIVVNRRPNLPVLDSVEEANHGLVVLDSITRKCSNSFLLEEVSDNKMENRLGADVSVSEDLDLNLIYLLHNFRLK